MHLSTIPHPVTRWLVMLFFRSLEATVSFMLSYLKKERKGKKMPPWTPLKLLYRLQSARCSSSEAWLIVGPVEPCLLQSSRSCCLPDGKTLQLDSSSQPGCTPFYKTLGFFDPTAGDQRLILQPAWIICSLYSWSKIFIGRQMSL